MSGYFNGLNIEEIYHGNDYIESVYKGDELIFDNSDILKKYIEGRSSFTIPKEATGLRPACFFGWDNLKKITFEKPCQLKSLNEACFQRCRSLQSIIIPNSVQYFYHYTFAECESLSEVVFEDGFEFKQTGALGYTFQDCSSLKTIILPNTTPSLGYYCFDGCKSLQSITIPNSVTGLGYGCFRYCESLQSITIPNSVTGLGDYCFQGCKLLTNIIFEDECQITKIPRYCFQHSPMTKITIPSSVTTIDGYGFNRCAQLTTIYVDKPTDSISGAPWGATNATVIWNDDSHYPEKPQPY